MQLAQSNYDLNSDFGIMIKNDFHRLLKRQIKDHLGDLNNTPENLNRFLEAINLAYKDYDKDLAHVELILKESSQELFKANKELNLLNAQNEQIIEEKTKHLHKITYNLQNAEKIAGLGNFSLDLSTKKLELSEQLLAMLNIKEADKNFGIDELALVFENPEELRQLINNSIETKTKFRLENISKKNSKKYFLIEGMIIADTENKDSIFLGVLLDITESVTAKENNIKLKEFYETILNNIPVEISVLNDQDKYLYINPIAVKADTNREFLIGKDDFEYCEHFDLDIEMAQKQKNIFTEVKDTHKTIEFTDKSENNDGSISYLLKRYFPILTAEKEFVYMLELGIDITEKTEQSIKLEQSLEEKEALLGEVHHRVKNNLALVLGMVEMQGALTDNDFLKHHLSEVQHRIAAMSLIHEKLYKSTNFAKIDLQDYLKDLVKFLSGFFNKGKDISIHFDIDKVYASTKKIVPIALIVNELITNCFKYAFKDKTSGDIFVGLKKTDQDLTLSISDNGPGLPSELDLNALKSLGFKLINIFTRQLKGTYELKNNPGLSVTIKFKNEQESINS